MIRISKKAFTACIFIFFFSAMYSLADDKSVDIEYELAISFDLDSQKMYGTAHLILPADHTIALDFNRLNINRILLQRSMATPAIVKHDGVSGLSFPAADVEQEIFISYELQVKQDFDNYIEKEGVTLLHSWFPTPSRDVIFSLIAELPTGFSAIAESDTLPSINQGEATFAFSHPVRTMHFVAAPFVISSKKVREGLLVYSYFHSEEQKLSANYLQAAVRYLRMYEEIIGPYPYNHFAIVENHRPTGYGMPTFTLLGKSVIRLPFIIDTSLGHEILHSWFGNGVRVKESSGNWSEGLTTYLADWYYREKLGEGGVNRKENNLKFHSYSHTDTAISLSQFYSASHNQPMARAVRSTGYVRGAMVFHELRKRLGDELFFQGIQKFYKQFKYSTAGWEDIEKVFSATADLPLEDFFSQRLETTYIPDIIVKDISYEVSADPIVLQFTIAQMSPTPFEFVLPFWVETNSGIVKFSTLVRNASERVEVELNSPPNTLIIDPEYDLLRQLDSGEHVLTIAHFLEHRGIVVVYPQKEEDVYAPLAEGLQRGVKLQMAKAEQVANSVVANSDLVIAGSDNKAANTLFGQISRPPYDVSITVKDHPLSRERAIMVITAVSKEALEVAVRKLRHYGKYSTLHFQGGEVVEKEIAPAPMGQRYTLRTPPKAVPTSQILDYKETVKQASAAQIIYIGETHTSMTDHHLQYLVLESLHSNHPDLAIGMEMFPVSSQESLDRYISAEKGFGEKEFLNESRYFDVWGFDYRLDRKIINYARQHRIPVIGLNIEREVVSSIFKEGSTDALTEDQLAAIPETRDLSLPGYYERLDAMHSIHAHGGHGSGKLGGFIQAQAIWDEVMAENIFNYLQNNPKRKMIVIAGSQHTRKDSGIPPRVARRMAVQQAVLLAADRLRKPTAETADYLIDMDEYILPEAAKIGISLEEGEYLGEKYLRITGLVSQSHAKEAGLKPDDILVAIDGYPISTMKDVKIAMATAEPGKSIDIVVKKELGADQNTRQLKVKLYRPVPPEEG